ncbi:rhomboid family intramembrane serine protease [Paraflavitalea sp. CAU 1676]|uniref:rhomboid family intramembrane serine protease n=1 Tax=Paraflavitalea sp. CAU 1676 TaxID=3032598 RepID=UPI0023DB4116|nr:rhomboid family intramembrane serine protease [Paraflavitalea sp. CAU 1676]MDF2186864.1 rhomboid family intramembrane serine protease [Paraflavitalea sp. CAU 1676]
MFLPLTPIVKNLLIINGLIFLAQITFQNKFPIDELFAQHHFLSKDFKPHQLLTYMFMHDTRNFFHIGFNMLALYMFGSKLEMVWGPKRFLTFYLVCGIGAGLISGLATFVETYPLISDLNFLADHPTARNFTMLVKKYDSIRASFSPETLAMVNSRVNDPNLAKEIFNVAGQLKGDVTRGQMVGASGAIFGLLAATGYLFPNDVVNIYFILPLKMKWFVLIYAGLELWSAIQNNPQDPVAHIAHLGGGLVGFLIVYFSYRRGNRRKLF